MTSVCDGATITAMAGRAILTGRHNAVNVIVRADWAGNAFAGINVVLISALGTILRFNGISRTECSLRTLNAKEVVCIWMVFI